MLMILSGLWNIGQRDSGLNILRERQRISKIEPTHAAFAF